MPCCLQDEPAVPVKGKVFGSDEVGYTVLGSDVEQMVNGAVAEPGVDPARPVTNLKFSTEQSAPLLLVG